MTKYFERVAAVRELMAEKGWDAVVIPASDPHGSEYPARRWKQVEWLSGFAGEAGDIVITASHAGLWTDTRYFVYASEVLPGTGIELHKTRVPGQVLIPQWLAQEAFPDTERRVVIALDGYVQSYESVRQIKDAFAESGRTEENLIIADAADFLNILWEDRPQIPQSQIITLGEEIVGQTRESKLTGLRKFLLQKDCDALLLTALDDIAWTLNVRGSDIAYNPLVLSYLLITMDEVSWFVRKDAFKEDEETRLSFDELRAEDIRVADYSDVEIALSELVGDDGRRDVRVYTDPSSLNFHLATVAESLCQLVFGTSPVALMKAVKNVTEIEGMREAHVEDGLALEKFLYWLDVQIDMGEEVTEWDAACKLGELRRSISGYRGDSFETISAYAEDAALPHYITPSEDAPVLQRRGLYLCDSGGQYVFGTTDITRTVALGPCTELEKEDYTLALKGHIALASAVFPRGTAGCQLDVLARNPMWLRKRNFGHGTGHGVGFFLGVHEGPQDIRQNFNSQPLLPGMIVSNEPGIYRQGQHGVRHENLMLVKEAGESEFGDWLCFENLTLCHIDTAPLVRSLLSEDEVEWINDYNRRVFETLSPRLPSGISAWLRRKTRKI